MEVEDMTTFYGLGQPVVETTDGSQTAWNIMGTSPVPVTKTGQWFVRVFGGHSRLIFNSNKTKSDSDLPPCRLVEFVGDGDEIDEIDARSDAPLLLPPGTKNITVTMASDLSIPRVYIRRVKRVEEQAPSSSTALPVPPRSSKKLPLWAVLGLLAITFGLFVLIAEYMKFLL